jgi:phosphosulfolactate synthase
MKHLLNDDQFRTILQLPERSLKDSKSNRRHVGLTHVVDDGISPEKLQKILSMYGDYIDLLEFSGGTSFVTDSVALSQKINACKRYNVKPMLSGLVFEKFAQANAVDQYLNICNNLGITDFIVSSCYTDIAPEMKKDYISTLAKIGAVYSVIGSSGVAHIIPPYKWIELIKNDIDAGALCVLAYGGVGNVGVYRGSCEMREGLIQEIISQVKPEIIIWDAPQVDQQCYFIELLGSDANFSKIALKEVAALESMRLGLHRKTFRLFDNVKE